MRIAYSSGRITNGSQMAKVAMIDLRDNNDREEHYNFRTYVTRARLVKANGNASNQAIWRWADPGGPGGASGQLAFTTMNEWLAAIESDRSTKSAAQKIVEHRPALAVDTCFREGKPVEAAVCDAIHTFTDTRRRWC